MKRLKKKRVIIVIGLAVVVLLLSVGAGLALNGYFGGGGAILSDTSTRGLVGYWDFSEGTGQTTNDSSDSNNDGTLGATSASASDDPAWTSGKAGNGAALDFDGTNDYVNIPNNNVLDITGDLTIMAWVRMDDIGSNDALVSNRVNGSGNTSPYSFGFDGPTDTLNFTQDSGGGAGSTVTSNDVVSTSTWNHVVARRTGSTTVTFFINGVQDSGGDKTLTDTPADGNQPVEIGRDSQNCCGVYIDGRIDEVRIYNRALSAAEIRYLYNRGGPVAHYKMDEGSGTTAFDASNISNDGTITGATYTTGQYGTALNFDGTDDVITVTNINPIDFDVGINDAVTFSAWINPDTAGEGSAGQVFFKGTNTWLRVDTLSGGRLDVEASLDLATTDATLNVSSAVPTGAWTHVVMQYEDDADDEITIYINGILVGTSTDGSGAPAADTNNLLIAGTTTNNFDGLIDDFRVYQYSRTAAEIRADYNAGLSTYFR